MHNQIELTKEFDTKTYTNTNPNPNTNPNTNTNPDTNTNTKNRVLDNAQSDRAGCRQKPH